MGVLDDAIREHLELKRRHGAAEEDLRRQEEEALGPARRDVAAEEAGDDSQISEEGLAGGEQAVPPGAPVIEGGRFEESTQAPAPRELHEDEGATDLEHPGATGLHEPEFLAEDESSEAPLEPKADQFTCNLDVWIEYLGKISSVLKTNMSSYDSNVFYI